MDEKRNFDLMTLGQVLLRLSPPDNERLVRGDTFVKQVGGAELATYVRETLALAKGEHTYQTIQEDGTVWFSGRNYEYQGADYTRIERQALTQTGTGTYYSLVIGDARIYNEKNTADDAMLFPKQQGGSYVWQPSTVTDQLRMARSVTIYENELLYINEKDLWEVFSSEFNLIDDEFERHLPDDAVITYTSSDVTIADFVYDAAKGMYYLKPTK